jgi:hypothetical protein
MPCQTDAENDVFPQIQPVDAGTPAGGHAVSPAASGRSKNSPTLSPSDFRIEMVISNRRSASVGCFQVLADWILLKGAHV